MNRTEKFRRQHAELASEAKAIAAELRSVALREDASAVRAMMARFLGKLRVHAAMEDGALYPELLAHPDEAVRSAAGALQRDVGPVYAFFDRFGRRWMEPGSVEADPDAFVSETLEAFALLRRRMAEEHAQLYPLVDSAA